jgi:hypothetical protein
MIRLAEYKDIEFMTSRVESLFAKNELEGTGLFTDRDTIEFLLQDLIDAENCVLLVDEEEGSLIGGIAGKIVPWVFNAEQIVLMEIFIIGDSRCLRQLRKALRSWGSAFNPITNVIMSPVPAKYLPEKKGQMRHMETTYAGLF